jgi:uncharacterized BrkB/YihY/UPF0761 family membrane protein
MCPAWAQRWRITRCFLAPLLLIVIAFIYKVMPNVHVRWSDVWVGALVTALLFTVGKYLIAQRGRHAGQHGAGRHCVCHNATK